MMNVKFLEIRSFSLHEKLIVNGINSWGEFKDFVKRKVDKNGIEFQGMGTIMYNYDKRFARKVGSE